MTNPFGLYIIVESDLSNHALDRAIAHTAMTQPRDVIVSSGGQYDRAMQACERIRAIAPHTRITYRKWPNDGAILLFGYNAASLYAAHVRPLLSWLRQYDIRFHLDNESVEDNMRLYSDATAQAIALADVDGIGLAVGSFATGNPAEHHYAQLDSMWRALASSPLSFWCPHEYYDMTPQRSIGHIYRFKEAWKYCDKAGIKRPDTCIQEYGLLIKYDPEAGWRRTSMSGKAAASQGIGVYDSWYKPDDISVCFYAFCGTDEKNSKWKDCSVDDDGFLKEIEDYAVPPIVVMPPAPPPAPPVVQPDSAGRYDLTSFLWGTGAANLMKNNWDGDEVMWTERGKDTIRYQRKNDHWEEFGLVRKGGIEYIVRGLDTSPGGGYAYILSNVDETPGSPWSPRLMKPGDVFYRAALVEFFQLKDGAPGPSYIDKTHLKFVKFHPTWKSWAGLTIANVIEMEVYTDKAGVPGFVWERYAYGHGLGLVGWQGGNNLKKMMGIAAHDGTLTKQPRMKLEWYPGLELPKMADIVITPGDSRFTHHTLRGATAAKFRVRAQPNTSAAIVATLEPVTDYPGGAIPRDLLTSEELAATADGANTWHVIAFRDNAGAAVVGYVRSDAGTVTPAIAPPDDVDEEERRRYTLAQLRAMEDQLRTAFNISTILRSLYEGIGE